jgi:flagellar biosynthesis protein FlhF
MMKLRMEHGDDAIPVSHRYIKEGGLLNSKLFATNLVELTAAIPEKKSVVKEKPLKKSTVDFTVGEDDPIKTRSLRDIGDILKKDELRETPARPAETIAVNTLAAAARKERTLLDTVIERPVPVAEERQPQSRINNTSIEKRFEKEFQEIKQTLNMLIQSSSLKTELMTTDCAENDRIIKPYIEILEKNDFDPEDRNLIIKEVRRSVSQEDFKDRYKIEKTLKDLLKNKILTSGPIKKGMKKKVIMFIGPTGVGKTTTMAKLGAIYALRENQKVSFVTIDTYRIAATEQLKKYAGIMKIPIHVVNDQTLFKEIIDKEKADIVMVDTSGRSHKNDLKISEIKSYADMVEYDFEKVLCVCANTKKGDLGDVFRAFEKIDFTSGIVTKIDEASYIGSIIDVSEKYKKPISYFTNGQEVPNDIFVAEPEKIMDMLVGGVNDYLGG